MTTKHKLIKLIDSLDTHELKSELLELSHTHTVDISNFEKKLYNYHELKAYSESDIKSILKLELDKIDLPDTSLTEEKEYVRPRTTLEHGVYERNQLPPILRLIAGVIICGTSIASFIFSNYYSIGTWKYLNLVIFTVGLLIMLSAIAKMLTPILIVREESIILYNTPLFSKKELFRKDIEKIFITKDQIKIRDSEFTPHIIPMFLLSKKDRRKITDNL